VILLPSKTNDFAGFTVYLCYSWEMCFPKVRKITKAMVYKYRKSYDLLPKWPSAAEYNLS